MKQKLRIRIRSNIQKHRFNKTAGAKADVFSSCYSYSYRCDLVKKSFQVLIRISE